MQTSKNLKRSSSINNMQTRKNAPQRSGINSMQTSKNLPKSSGLTTLKIGCNEPQTPFALCLYGALRQASISGCSSPTCIIFLLLPFPLVHSLTMKLPLFKRLFHFFLSLLSFNAVQALNHFMPSLPIFHHHLQLPPSYSHIVNLYP